MAMLTEQEVFAPFIGKTLNENYDSLTWDDFMETLVLYNYEWMDNPDLRKQFGVTDNLYEDWLYRGIGFALALSIDDGEIIGGYVEKIREGDCGHFKPNIHVLTPTQQELRIVRRILEYITHN
jgi:hypothetical protein